MYRKDYIQRQFEEFGKVLAVLLGYKGRQDWDNFEKELDQAAGTFSETDLPAVIRMDSEEFRTSVVDTIPPEKKKILARLLFEKLDHFAAIHDYDAFNETGQKCLLLYTDLDRNQTSNEFDMDISYKLKALEQLGFSFG